MNKQIVRTDEAPNSPLYSQGVKVGEYVHVSGMVGVDVRTGNLAGPTIQEQTRQREEQRRLFYVGLTRSTETLVISSAVRIPSGVAMQMGVPVLAGRHGVAILQASPFLAELGPQAPNSIHGNAWRANLGF